MMNFTAFDFETANYQRTSACAIGITRVEAGEIVEERSFLIRPYPDYFHYMNIQVHGITPDHVADAFDFGELWPLLKLYFEDQFLVAHNASFDISVLRYVLAHYDLPAPNFEYACTLKLARKVWKMERYGLANLSQVFGIALQHHDAQSDASACAQIMNHICADRTITSTQDIKDQFGSVGRLHAVGHVPFSTAAQRKKKNQKSRI